MGAYEESELSYSWLSGLEEVSGCNVGKGMAQGRLGDK